MRNKTDEFCCLITLTEYVHQLKRIQFDLPTNYTTNTKLEIYIPKLYNNQIADLNNHILVKLMSRSSLVIILVSTRLTEEIQTTIVLD